MHFFTLASFIIVVSFGSISGLGRRRHGHKGHMMLMPIPMAEPIMQRPQYAILRTTYYRIRRKPMPIISHPIISKPIIAQPIISQPIISQPIISTPLTSDPCCSTCVCDLGGIGGGQILGSSLGHTNGAGLGLGGGCGGMSGGHAPMEC